MESLHADFDNTDPDGGLRLNTWIGNRPFVEIHVELGFQAQTGNGDATRRLSVTFAECSSNDALLALGRTQDGTCMQPRTIEWYKSLPVSIGFGYR